MSLSTKCLEGVEEGEKVLLCLLLGFLYVVVGWVFFFCLFVFNLCFGYLLLLGVFLGGWVFFWRGGGGGGNELLFTHVICCATFCSGKEEK